MFQRNSSLPMSRYNHTLERKEGVANVRFEFNLEAAVAQEEFTATLSII